MEKKRFISSNQLGMAQGEKIITDSKTGVQYLFVYERGCVGGLTVLVDKEGKPLLDEEYISKG